MSVTSARKKLPRKLSYSSQWRATEMNTLFTIFKSLLHVQRHHGLCNNSVRTVLQVLVALVSKEVVETNFVEHLHYEGV